MNDYLGQPLTEGQHVVELSHRHTSSEFRRAIVCGFTPTLCVLSHDPPTFIKAGPRIGNREMWKRAPHKIIGLPVKP